MFQDDASIARAALDACASGDADAMADVVHRHFWPLYDRHGAALRAAVATLSGPDLARHPVLRMLHPMAPAVSGSSEPIDVHALAQASVAGKSGGDVIGTMQVMASRMNGDLLASADHARELAARLHQVDVPERAQSGSILWFMHYQIGSALLMMGDTAGAIGELTTAREIGRSSGSTNAERASLARLALAEVLRGSVASASASLATGRALPPLAAPFDVQDGPTEAVVALLIALERAESASVIDPAMLSRVESTEFTWPFVTLARARYGIFLGRPIDALEAVRLATATHHVQDGTLPADILARAYVEVFLLLGHLSAAVQAARSVSTPGPMLISQLTRLDLIQGDLDAAAERLRVIGSTRVISPVFEAEITCLRVWEMVARRSVSSGLATRFVRVVLDPDSRRVVRMVPAWVVDEVRPQIPDELRGAFETATANIVFADIGYARPPLTSSERRVLAALPQHERVADLASALFLSPNTVKTHLASLYRKLGVSSRREAIEMRDTQMRDDWSENDNEKDDGRDRGG